MRFTLATSVTRMARGKRIFFFFGLFALSKGDRDVHAAEGDWILFFASFSSTSAADQCFGLLTLPFA